MDKKLEEAYKQIRAMKKESAGSGHRKHTGRKHYVVTGCSAAAAAFLIAVIYCISNPTLAAQLPIIGHIFEGLEQQVSYPGDYSDNAVIPESAGEGETTGTYQEKSGNMTLALSEVTYDSNAVYLAILVESKEGFSQDAIDENVLYLNCKTDMYRKDGGKDTFREEDGNALAWHAEGEFVDEHTFKGIIQMTPIELSQYNSCDIIFSDVKQELKSGELKTGELGNSGEIISYMEYDWKEYEGEWSFHLDFADYQTAQLEVELNDVNEQGFGIEKIVKTEYELYAVPIYPAGGEDYIVTIWDADGKPLDSHGSNVEIRSIYGRDVSTITIYILTWDDFTECKGNNSYLQPQKALYQTTVELEQGFDIK